MRALTLSEEAFREFLGQLGLELRSSVYWKWQTHRDGHMVGVPSCVDLSWRTETYRYTDWEFQMLFIGEYIPWMHPCVSKIWRSTKNPAKFFQPLEGNPWLEGSFVFERYILGLPNHTGWSSWSIHPWDHGTRWRRGSAQADGGHAAQDLLAAFRAQCRKVRCPAPWAVTARCDPRYITSMLGCLKMVSTPLYPMVLLIIIPMKNGYFIGNIPNIFRQTQYITSLLG